MAAVKPNKTKIMMKKASKFVTQVDEDNCQPDVVMPSYSFGVKFYYWKKFKNKVRIDNQMGEIYFFNIKFSGLTKNPSTNRIKIVLHAAHQIFEKRVEICCK